MDEMAISIPRQAGILVRREREAQGKTRAQLAHMAHVSERLLASLELGDAPGIQLDKLLAVCGALGIELRMSAMSNRPPDEATIAEAELPEEREVTGAREVGTTDNPSDSSYESAWHDFMMAQGFAGAPLPISERSSKEG